jgi:vanillate monooxygenase ferredoxin subunit
MMNNTMQVRISTVSRQTDEINSVELLAIDGGELPVFEAGAHIDVHTDAGIRQYSLCNDPSDRLRYLLGVKHEIGGRGGSHWLHTAVREGDLLTIGMPRNNFHLAPKASNHLLFGGGIGITPMLAMADALWQRGEKFTFYCFARSRMHLAFSSHLQEAPWADRVKYHFDAAGEDKLDLSRLLARCSDDTHIYMCGPKGFMDAVKGAAVAWPEEYVHLEYFSAEPVEHLDADKAFEVLLARSGQVFKVGVNDTIAQVLIDGGVEILTSCEQGVCGTCITKFLDGEPEHRDFCLSKKERESKVALCCSRARTERLVLDL